MASTGYVSGNLLLDRLPLDAFEELRPQLEIVSLTVGEVLYEGGARTALPFVYFPIDGVTSMLASMADGRSVEAGTVGREGLIGAQSAFGSAKLLERWISQVPGASARMDAGAFRAHFNANGALRELVLRYVQSYLASLAQSVACNRLHLASERCARWLLLTHDRANRDTFLLTQEFLALMLGLRRPGVSVAAAGLQAQGYISYVRGQIVILNRQGLESASCECYGVTTREWQRVVKDFDE